MAESDAHGSIIFTRAPAEMLAPPAGPDHNHRTSRQLPEDSSDEPGASAPLLPSAQRELLMAEQAAVARRHQAKAPHYREPLPASTGLPATRATKQRKAVADLLSQFRDFRSAQQIHAILRDRGNKVGLATVYRTLGVMVNSGHVDFLTREDGETVYLQCSDRHHHHLLCRSCGRSIEIAGQAVVDWADAVGEEHGYTHVTHTLELFGLCPECSPAEPAAR